VDAEVAEAAGTTFSPAQERADPDPQQWLVEGIAPSHQAAKTPASPSRHNGTAERADSKPTQPPTKREAALKQRVSELEWELSQVTKRAERETAKAGQAVKGATELKDARQELM
jgi:hypothetical protein